MKRDYRARLAELGWLDLLEESPPVSGDCRFLREFFLPARGRYRRAQFEALAPAPPATAAGLAERGRIARILGDKDGARALFERALKKDPASARARLFAAELDLVADPKAALVGLDAVEPAGRVWRAYALFLLGDVPDALELLRETPLTTGLILRGILSERADDAAGAERAFSAAIASAPCSPGLCTLRGTVRWKLGKFAEAIEDAHRGLLLHPENLDTFVRILYLSRGQKAAGEARAEREILLEACEKEMSRDPKQAWVWAARAGVLGKSRLQIESLRKAVLLEPKRAWIQAFLGRALSGDDGDGVVDPKSLAEGLKHLKEAARLAPEIGWIRSWNAEVLKKLGRPREALKALDAGIALDPDYRLAYAWRSCAREAAGDVPGAIADIGRCLDALDRPSFRHRRAALQWRAGTPTTRTLEDLAVCAAKSARYAFHYGGLNEGFPGAGVSPGLFAVDEKTLSALARREPRSGLARAWLGRLALRAADLEAAERHLESALARDARCWPALAWRGEARCRAGRFAQALEDLEAAESLEPSYVGAPLWRAVALFALGRKDEAMRELARAGGMSPADAALARQWSRWALPRFAVQRHEVRG